MAAGGSVDLDGICLPDDDTVFVREADRTPAEQSAMMNAKRHPFMTRDLKHPVNESLSTQALIADFRARGGLLSKQPQLLKGQKTIDLNCTTSSDGSGVSEDDGFKKDNQRLPVLMCMYTHSNETLFCVDPSLITMEVS